MKWGLGSAYMAVRRKVGVGRVIGFLMLLLFVQLRVWDPVLVEMLRQKVFDTYQWIKPREITQRPVVIVDLDEISLRTHGQWPWPRTLVAKLVNKIKEAGAVAVAFDITFPEPDRMSPRKVAESLPELEPSVRSALSKLRSNDAVFAEAIRNYRVVLGQSGYTAEAPIAISAKTPKASIAEIGGPVSSFLFKVNSLTQNIPILEQSAAGRGLFSILPEYDGVIRRVPLVMQVQDRIIPAISIELLRVATGQSAVLVRRNEIGIQNVTIARVPIPTDAHARFWVHYSNSDPKRYVSARDLLSDNPAAKEKLKQRLVLIGTSAIGLRDLRVTPVDPVMPGVEVHAQMLETILTKSFLERPAYLLGAEVILTILSGLAVIILVPIFGASTVVLGGACFAAAVASVSGYLYHYEGILMDVSFPLFTSLVIFLALFFSNYLREENARRQVRSAFGQYLSPALVEQLADDPDKLVLGGETREVTLLFSDVRNFTATSERYKDDPQGLTALMNRFLTPLSNAIIETNGTIDKYMGDAVMALWNAPLEDTAHARNALRAALMMIERLEAVNKDREREANEAGQIFDRLDAGIGVNTGTCVVGNMGSDLRFDYSAMGDPVNIASRLEGQTKKMGVRILVGENTANQAEGFGLLEVDLIRVVGKQLPERIYCLLGDEEIGRSPRFKDLQIAQAGFLETYRSARWDEAETALSNLSSNFAEEFELQTLISVYAERIQALRSSETTMETWDGVYSAESK